LLHPWLRRERTDRLAVAADKPRLVAGAMSEGDEGLLIAHSPTVLRRQRADRRL
jgi:hypothetical protein